MKTTTLSFEKIILAEFGNANLNDIVKKLAEHNLFDFITNSINQINEHITNKDEELKRNGILNIAPIGAIMLIKFNEYFRELLLEDKLSDKQELEYILGNITKRILKLIVDAVPVSIQQRQLLSLAESLVDTCKLYKYDFDKLSEFIQIDDLILEVYAQKQNEMKDSDRVVIPIQEQLPSFFCSSLPPESLNHLIEILNKESITSDNEKIRQLFNNPTENLSIQFNETKVVHVLQFMAVLKNTRLISHQNCDGFYQVLDCHVKNFSSVFLNGKTPQRRIDAVKKLKSWFVNKDKFEGLLKKLVIQCHSA